MFRDMAHEWLRSVLEGSDNTTGTEVCSGNLSTASCHISNPLSGESHAIAGTRMIASSLSILGAVSIIFTAIAKRQVSSPKVHPIFVLSVADLMLALLWVLGGIVWLRQTPGMHKMWCFAVSLPTVVLEGVTVNLTLVYALLAYSNIKQTENSGRTRTINLNRPQNERVWHPCRVFLAYFIAWILPVAILAVFFAVAAGRDHLVQDTRDCGCWCIPTFGNILPFTNSIDEPSAKYVYNVSKIVAFYGWVVGSNYLVVFILLMVIYHKTLKRIKRIKADAAVEQGRQSEETQLLIQKGECRARRRVLYFLASFLFTGLFNVVLSYAVVIALSKRLSEGPQVVNQLSRGSSAQIGYVVLILLQSITVPIQGFLNAIVYGWTREDFISVHVNSDVYPTEAETEMEVSQEQPFAGSSLESSGIHLSVQDHRFIHTLGLSRDSEEDG